MRSKLFSLLTVLTLSVLLVLVCSCAAPTISEAQLKDTNLKIQSSIQSELDNLDHDLADAASKLGRTSLSGDGASQILNGLCAKYPYLIDCATADTSGKAIAIAPDAYRKFEGADFGIEDTQNAALSLVFKAVEGMNGVALMRPVISEKGDHLGAVSALFEPKSMLAPIVEPVLKGTGIELNVTQTDGLNIYDLSGTDTGKNLLTGAEYKEYKDLVALGARFASEESGTGTYTYPSHVTTEAQVKKLAVWSSAKLHGTAWRLVCVQEITQ